MAFLVVQNAGSPSVQDAFVKDHCLKFDGTSSPDTTLFLSVYMTYGFGRESCIAVGF